MLLSSIMYQLVRCLLCLPVVLVRRDLSKDAELLALRHENHVLRRQIARCTIRWPTVRGCPPYPGCCHAAAGPRSSR
jgi:hypothetical protein